MAGPWIAIGQVLAPHGVKGAVRVRPFGSFPERFQPGITVRLDTDTARPLRVTSARVHGDTVILTVAGIDDRDAAERLRGRRLVVAAGERHPLPPDHYYVDDLRGLPVMTSGGRRVGVVQDVEANPANDLLVVARDEGERVLVPLVRALVRIDMAGGRIVVDDLPGLLPGAGAEERA